MASVYKEAARDLLAGISPRTREFVSRRFGLGNMPPQTLDAIGKEYGITRERVRQIVFDGLEAMRSRVARDERARNLGLRARGIMEENGGICREDLLFSSLNCAKEAPHVVFLLLAGDLAHYRREDRYFHAFWAILKEDAERVAELGHGLAEILESAKRTMEAEEFSAAREKKPKNFEERRMILPALSVTKRIMRGHDERWGLREWPHVNPRTIRDKAHLILSKESSPLHFRDVRDRIEEFERSIAETSKRKKSVLPQTVHNELIKDDRFVLVGRGTYGLLEWGYRPGTVKDVISALLQDLGAMTKEEIVKRTLQQRQVKETTILLNLQNRSCFARDADGRYHIR